MADHLVAKFRGLCGALTVALLTLALIVPASAEASGPGLDALSQLSNVVPAPAQAAVAAALAQVPSPSPVASVPSATAAISTPAPSTQAVGPRLRRRRAMSRRWPSRSRPRLGRTPLTPRQRFPYRQSRYARRANGRIRPLEPGPTRPSVGRRAHIASRVRRGAGPGRGAFEAQLGRRRRGRAHSPPSERGGHLCRPPTPSSFTPTTPRPRRRRPARAGVRTVRVTSPRVHPAP